MEITTIFPKHKSAIPPNIVQHSTQEQYEHRHMPSAITRNHTGCLK